MGLKGVLANGWFGYERTGLPGFFILGELGYVGSSLGELGYLGSL